MSARLDLNEAALNMSKMLALITGLNDKQLDALLVSRDAPARLKAITIDLLRYAAMAKENEEHIL